MKTLYTVLLATISFFPAWLQAKQVSKETALQVAETQVRSRNQLRSNQTPALNLIHTETIDGKATNALFKSSGITSTNVIYYVYNVEGKGFVIVSGDDIATPILGYSDSGTYDPNNLSPNFVYYLNCLAMEIKEAIANGLPQSDETKEQWDAYMAGNSLKTVASGTPLLDIEGIKWGQSAPYNGMCPIITVNNKQTQTVTGCVATAMAQIMRYYKYPNQGKGTIASYSTKSADSVTITIPSKNLALSNYNWNIMNPAYPYAVYNENDPAQKAVALLMYDCGISSKMQYDTPDYGSGAYNWDAGNALINNFSYSKGLTYKLRTFYSDTEWEALLKAEIDAGRPVFYAGQDNIKNMGHAFVCDGYDGNNFHFNWGWDGYQNGFFPTTALNPNTTEGYRFNDSQEILTGISPNGTNNYEIILDAGSTKPMKLTSSKSQVDNNSTDLFSVSAQFYFNIGFTSLRGYLNIALYNQTNQLVQILSPLTDANKKATIVDLEPMGYGYSISFNNIRIPSSVLPGNYFIQPIVVDSVSNDIIPVRLYSTTSLPLTVKGIVLDSTSLNLSVGNQAQLTPSVFMSPAPIVIWSSSNTNIATVDASGLVKGINIGSATITASVTSGTTTYNATCAVTVINGGNGLKEINPDMKVNVYEANGYIQITSAASNQIKEIEIYNLQGLLIYKEASINVISYTVNKKLPAGVYIVKVISEKNTDNVKLVLH